MRRRPDPRHRAVIGWLDAQAGASGDMFVGALADAGVPLAVMQTAIDQLELGIELRASEAARGGIGGTKVDVRFDDDAHSRPWRVVREMLAAIEQPVRTIALGAFERLAQAEAAVHRTAIGDVHFHEVGAHDALADIVGTAAGFAHLGLTELHCSPVALGHGTTRGHHGPIPLPAPAVLTLLARAPVTAGAVEMESTTPTGAALLATLVTHWGPFPTMTLERTGHGCGTRDPDGVANVLRLVLGDPATTPEAHVATAFMLQANVDDQDPRLWPHVLQALLDAGADDAWLTPILMKKGRPAHTLSTLCTAITRDAVRRVLFRETTTIGLRELRVDKHTLERTTGTVELDDCTIRVKRAWLHGTLVNLAAEWDDVLAAAQRLGRPAKTVANEAIELASTERRSK
jgi:pyridinium-3,5-bisthiocarboxylic acid mononucleotide nickel chelatase